MFTDEKHPWLFIHRPISWHYVGSYKSFHLIQPFIKQI